MKFDESIYLKIQSIYNDLQLLQDGHFYEHDSVPGTPSYHTLASRMQKNLSAIEKAMKEAEKAQ
mgnify:FL=1